ncbi:hypothetical protein ABEB36_012788 [Hypothenemus hampei]|uniref:Uncharacterized protein n=1 Tax=Hypothenemus hampei TaxID=57062 RepID=A0ABD1E5S6_HYPHA
MGIIGHQFIGPFFIEGNLNSASYLQLLQNEIVPSIAAIFPGENGEQVANNIWFQQDGAPPNYALAVREYLVRFSLGDGLAEEAGGSFKTEGGIGEPAFLEETHQVSEVAEISQPLETNRSVNPTNGKI